MSTGKLRVMTWNLWWRFGPWEERLAAIEAVVRAEDPDVLCLQEVWSAGGTSSAAILAERIGHDVALTGDAYPESPPPVERVGFHNAILSRWPLRDPESHSLPNRAGEPGHRRALSLRVETPFGPWPVLTTHTDYRFDDSATRQVQCERILQLVDGMRADPERDLPPVVAGDFNAVPDSDEIRMLTGRRAAPVRNLVLTDCWEVAGDGPGATWRRDNPYQADTAWPDRRLDYVFVAWPRPKPVGNPLVAWLAGLDEVDGVHPSDHAAVVVDLATPDL